MAKEPKAKAKLALPDETTYAVVSMTNKRFQNANGEPDPTVITADVTIAFNGELSGGQGNIGVQMTYAVSSTRGQVQTAIRNLTNSWLGQTEPGNTLNNTHILLDGLSD